MKRIKGVFNLILLIAVIALNIWIFSVETTYSARKISKKLEKTKKRIEPIKLEILVCKEDLTFEKEEIKFKKSKMELEDFGKIFELIANKQYSLLPFFSKSVKVKDVFKTDNGVVVNVNGFNPEDYSLLECYLFKKLISENIFLLYRIDSVSFIFENGMKKNKSDFIFNED